MSNMPVLFIGHGSPMNAIEDNTFTRNWKEIGGKIPTPKAILAISAHWFVKGTRVLDDSQPKMTYDMYGFPEELYRIIYDSPGAPEVAHRVKSLIRRDVITDNSWGYDHGTWSVLHHLYPNRDIPVFQLSIDGTAPSEVHYTIGQQLKILREEGVLIFGTGNIVHNLRMVDWNMENTGFDWAYEFDNYVIDSLIDKNHENIIHYEKAGVSASLAVPTPDHYFPLLYVLGASNKSDTIHIYNNSCVLGSLSMTCCLFES